MKATDQVKRTIERDLLDALDALERAIHRINTELPERSSAELREARDEIKSELQKHYDKIARQRNTDA